MKVFMFDKVSVHSPFFGALPQQAWTALGILELVCMARPDHARHLSRSPSGGACAGSKFMGYINAGQAPCPVHLVVLAVSAGLDRVGTEPRELYTHRSRLPPVLAADRNGGRDPCAKAVSEFSRFVRTSNDGDRLVRSCFGGGSGMRPCLTTKRRKSFGVIRRASRNRRLKFDRFENPASEAITPIGRSVSTSSMQARPIRNLPR